MSNSQNIMISENVQEKANTQTSALSDEKYNKEMELYKKNPDMYKKPEKAKPVIAAPVYEPSGINQPKIVENSHHSGIYGSWENRARDNCRKSQT